MPKLRKDTLYAQTYVLADGRPVTYTSDDVRHLRSRLREMLSVGVPIPFYLEHADDEEPKPKRNWDYAADRTRNTIGWVSDGSVPSEGLLETILEVPDELEASKLPSIRFVSPQIETDFRDGDGRVWPGLSITHVAATARPIQMRQKPFTAASRLSMAVGNKVRLSLGDEPMAEEMDKEKDKEPPMEKKDEKPDESPAPPPEMVVPESTVDEAAETEARMGELKYFQTILEDLKSIGLHLPENTTPENFAERVHTACLTLKGDGKDDDETEAENTGVPAEQKEPTEVPQTPIMMSMGRQLVAALKRATASDVKAKKAEGRTKAALSMAGVFQARAVKSEQEQILARLQVLQGKRKISVPTYEKLKKQATTAKLSLDPKTGALNESTLLAQIQILEEEAEQITPSLFLKPDALSQGGIKEVSNQMRPDIKAQAEMAARIAGRPVNVDRMAQLANGHATQN